MMLFKFLCTMFFAQDRREAVWMAIRLWEEQIPRAGAMFYNDDIDSVMSYLHYVPQGNEEEYGRQFRVDSAELLRSVNDLHLSPLQRMLEESNDIYIERDLQGNATKEIVRRDQLKFRVEECSDDDAMKYADQMNDDDDDGDMSIIDPLDARVAYDMASTWDVAFDGERATANYSNIRWGADKPTLISKIIDALRMGRLDKGDKVDKGRVWKALSCKARDIKLHETDMICACLAQLRAHKVLTMKDDMLKKVREGLIDSKGLTDKQVSFLSRMLLKARFCRLLTKVQAEGLTKVVDQGRSKAAVYGMAHFFGLVWDEVKVREFILAKQTKARALAEKRSIAAKKGAETRKQKKILEQEQLDQAQHEHYDESND